MAKYKSVLSGLTAQELIILQNEIMGFKLVSKPKATNK